VECPAEAIEFIGKTMSVEEVVTAIAKDTVFYDESRGGVTISGGEPLLQPSFLLDLLTACGEIDLHRTVDTCGYADRQILLKVAARTELFLYDLKHMDPDKHYRYTGVPNEIILSNLEMLSRCGAGIIIRLPLIPGINSDVENIDRTGAFVSSLPGVDRINLLPYHCLAENKYKNLGFNNPAADIEHPDGDDLKSIAGRLENFDLKVKIGG
jgi:pyruvate formate lyase activating enzyme